MGVGGGSYERFRPGADESGFHPQQASLGGGPTHREDGPAPGPWDLDQHREKRPASTSSFFLAIFISASVLLFLP